MRKKEILFSLMAAMVLALTLSPFASSWPDGLERVAQDKGFLKKGETAPLLKTPLADYLWPQVQNERWATSLAGLAGTLAVFGMGYGLAGLLKRGRKR
jgi:cobalt/nickel transport protein